MDNWDYAFANYSVKRQLAWSTVPTVAAYNATITHVHDGDTYTVEVATWLGETVETNVRLLGCNCAELGTPSGNAARDYVTALLAAGTPVVLTHVDNDKYGGRTDATVTFLLNGVVTDLADHLIAEQYAAAWNGSGKQPVPPWPRTVT